MSRYRWIVFDLDGTLFDYDSAESEALTSTFAEYELAFDDETHRLYGEINGRLWEDFEQGKVSSVRLRVQRFEELGRAMGVGFLASEFSDRYLLNLGAQAALMEGAEMVIRDLDQEFDLALATNGIASVQRSRLKASKLGPFFGPLVISEEVGAAKPDEKFFGALFDRLERPRKSEVLLVGDSLSSDIAGGVAFGIDTCWFNPTGRNNDAEIRPAYEIRELLELKEIVL